MKPYQNQPMNANVAKIIRLYTNSQTSQGVKPHYEHPVVEAHLLGNAEMKYTIIDPDNLIKTYGVQEIYIRPLTPQELEDLKKLPTTSQWYNPSLQVYKTQHPVDLTKYFTQVSWTPTLELWVTEGLTKDPRLIDCFKSLIIPLTGNPTQAQPLNAHAVWDINTGIGKTYLTLLLGCEPIVTPTQAGAIGSYDQTRNGAIIIHGFLHGEGFPVLLDEVNTGDKPLIQYLLTYLETGTLIRGLKHRINLNANLHDT